MKSGLRTNHSSLHAPELTTHDLGSADGHTDSAMVVVHQPALLNLEAGDLRELVLAQLREMGFVIAEDGSLRLPSADKKVVRQLHNAALQMEIAANQAWLRQRLPECLPFFANGDEVSPERIDPKLIEVKTDQHHNLFRAARLLWSIPLSNGYGRRIRFVVIDQSNGKLIGILALQSPPLDFLVRDRLFNYPTGRKTEFVNQTMDIHALGALPPYNALLAGKLVALAAASNEVRQAYWRKYAGRMTEIEGRVLPAHLVALTTTSAFGRSSLYNRLKYKKTLIAESLGYTEGYGTFHLIGVYPLFRKLLESKGVSTRGGFGVGPRRKWQTIRRALSFLGLSPDLLCHGVKREAFLFRLVDNLEAYMEGRESEPAYRDLPFSELAAWWRERWLLPRAGRVDHWRAWRSEEIKNLLLIGQGEGEKRWS